MATTFCSLSSVLCPLNPCCQGRQQTIISCIRQSHPKPALAVRQLGNTRMGTNNGMPSSWRIARRQHLPQIGQCLAARHCYCIRRGIQQCFGIPLRLAALVADGIFHRCAASLECIGQELASAIPRKIITRHPAIFCNSGSASSPSLSKRSVGAITLAMPD